MNITKILFYLLLSIYTDNVDTSNNSYPKLMLLKFIILNSIAVLLKKPIMVYQRQFIILQFLTISIITFWKKFIK